jgi:hypothetical protein
MNKVIARRIALSLARRSRDQKGFGTGELTAKGRKNGKKESDYLAPRRQGKNDLSFRPKGEIFLDPSNSLGMTGVARHLAFLASWRDYSLVFEA